MLSSYLSGFDLHFRPDVEDLKSHGVLRDTDVAPKLEAMAAKLEMNMKKDDIGHMLEARPDIDELIVHGIIQDERVAALKIQSAR